jgi:hypothetical protein
MLQSRGTTRAIAVCSCWAADCMRTVSGVHAGCLGYHHGTWKASWIACDSCCQFQSALHGIALVPGSALCPYWMASRVSLPSPEPTGADSDLLGCSWMILQDAMLPQGCCLPCREWSSTSGRCEECLRQALSMLWPWFGVAGRCGMLSRATEQDENYDEAELYINFRVSC